MLLNKEKIKHIAKLSDLEFSDSKIEKSSQQLSAILEYVKLLDEIEIAGVKATAQTTGLKNVYQEDKPSEERGLTQEDVLSNAPEKQDGFIKIEAVFG